MMLLSIHTTNHNNKFKFDLLHILLVNYFPVSFKSISFREILRLCSTCHHFDYITFLGTRGFLGSMFVTYFRNSSVTFSSFVLQTRVQCGISNSKQTHPQKCVERLCLGSLTGGSGQVVGRMATHIIISKRVQLSTIC